MTPAHSGLAESMENSTSFPLDAAVLRPAAEIHVQLVVLALLCVGGILGNVFVGLVICFDSRLHKPTFYFIASMAAADFLVAVMYIPLYMAAVRGQQWTLPVALCHTHAATISMSLNASLMTLALVSLDRFYAIINPLRYQTILTTSRSTVLIAISWVYAIFWAATPLVGWGDISYDPKTSTCRPNWGATGLANRVYALSLGLFAFFLPTVGMIYCYVKIFQVARHHVRAIKQNSIPADGSSPAVNVQEKKALKTVLLVIGAFVVSWLPYTVVSFAKLLGKGTFHLNATAANAVLTITLLNGCLNPVIYSIRDKRFKRGLKKIFCRYWGQQEFDSYASTVASSYTQRVSMELEDRRADRNDKRTTNAQ